MNQPSRLKNRPTGIVIIAVLWTLGSMYNIYVSLSTIIIDLSALPYLSDPYVDRWLRFGVPAEMMIGFFILAFGFLTLVVVYGLLTARAWSYDSALALPIFIIVLNSASMLLYLSAPSELGLSEAGITAAGAIFGNIIILVLIWVYLTRPYVKQYLNKIPTPTPMPVPVPPAQSILPVPPPPMPVATSEEKKFCRYCGAENKTDAVFCEKCGKNIG